MSNATFCWQCGHKLATKAGNICFREHVIDGNTVRVHVECSKNLGKPEPDYAQSRTKSDVRRYLHGSIK